MTHPITVQLCGTGADKNLYASLGGSVFSLYAQSLTQHFHRRFQTNFNNWHNHNS